MTTNTTSQPATTTTPAFIPAHFTAAPVHALDFRQFAALPGGWVATRHEDTRTDWNKYSKAWHRSYGPARTTENRRVTFRRVRGRGVQEITVNLDGWRGDFMARALLESGIIAAQKGNMHIRLNAAYDIREVRSVRGFRIFERTLAGQFVDFCAVTPLGMTYHADTVAECFAGLRAKAQRIERQKVAVIDWAYVRRLGFCEPGIKAFCSAFGFNLRHSYTPDEIAAAIRANPAAAAPFVHELRVLAGAVGFHAPELTA